MESAGAESLESIARFGRTRSLVALLDANDLELVLRRMRGPEFSVPRLGSRGRKEAQRRVRSALDGLRPVSITLCSDLDVTDEAVLRLMHLSRLDDLAVYAGRDLRAPEEFKNLITWQLHPAPEQQPDETNFAAVVRGAESTANYGVFLQHGWRDLATLVSGDGDPSGAATWIDLQFHQALESVYS